MKPPKQYCTLLIFSLISHHTSQVADCHTQLESQRRQVGSVLGDNSSQWDGFREVEDEFGRQLMADSVGLLNLDWPITNSPQIRNGPRLLQRILDETQVLPSASSSTNPSRPPGSGLCLWNCAATRQNTTNLLLFSQAGTGDEPDAQFTKYTTIQELKQSGFAANRPTILMVHGFRGSGLTHQRWAIDLKDLILARERGNVLFADWSHHARVISYIHALEHIAEVTEDLYSIFENLEAAFARFRMTEVHAIGHSLGAHVAGLLGQMMNGQLNQITALDPTGFLLTSASANLKLTQDDAKYVSAFHTNAKYLGTEMNLADRDVFFNGGSDQPACKSIASKLIPGACSHRQAVKYASTFMNRCIMVAYLCKDYEKFLDGECGFCPSNSDACVGVGNEWQYSSLSGPMRPKKFDKKKATGDRPWTDGQVGQRYHIKMGAERPYCMFAYQVVVKFADSSNLDEVSSFDLVLRVANRTTDEGVWVHLANRLRPDARLEVFNGPGKERQITVSGRYLFTGLAFVERAHELFDESPVRFTEASLANPFREKANQPKVYVNFMSNPKFEVRASNSGPIEHISFVNMEQVQASREPRLESRSDDRLRPQPTSRRAILRRHWGGGGQRRAYLGSELARESRHQQVVD